MPFDSESFMATEFTPRTAEKPVPQLKRWFPKGQKPVWKIRAISGTELGQTEESVRQAGSLQKMLTGLLSINANTVQKEVEKLIGSTKDKPEIIAKRLYHLHYGTVWEGPEERVPFEICVKICQEFGLLFYDLTNSILLLSGEGNIPEKPTPSGKTKK